MSENLDYYNSFEKKKGFTVPMTVWLPKYKNFFLEVLPKIKCLKNIFPQLEIKKLCLGLGNDKYSVTVVWRLIFFSLLCLF